MGEFLPHHGSSGHFAHPGGSSTGGRTTPDFPPGGPSARAVLDQFRALDRSLPGLPSQPILQHFQAMAEELRVAKKDCDAAVGMLSTASRKSSELTTALMQQQGLVDETNALATRQRRRLEELQEEVHCTRDHAAFVEQMVKEYPDEGFYEVILPPLSELEGDLKKINEDL
ncbi:hypothetical protein LENED_011875 [Lentinula edodes]|uniref:Uncharacterized protein n=1 Tax=Lentinula edodes TaxID=5353 RepID=A0A1Q3ER66_LENED|nr:hypothetical protein LENED_011875 [Lentinula edodes]